MSTTDEEHEATLRALVADRDDPGQITNGRAIAAVLRLLDEARAEIQRMRTSPASLSIVGTWLVESVDHCTCGTLGGPWPHEGSCGLEPVADLSTLPGWKP